MNELARTYGPQGFHVVAVSDESSSLIGDYISEKGVGYGVANAQGVLRMYGGQGYPSAWLIGPKGNIAWEGHPQALTGQTIEPLLALVNGAVPAPTGRTTDGGWWMWLVMVAGMFFVGALGWFWYSTRDKSPSINAVLYGQQQMPPPGSPPQEPPPPGTPYGAPAQQHGPGSQPPPMDGAPPDYRPPQNDAPYLGGPPNPPQPPHDPNKAQ